MSLTAQPKATIPAPGGLTSSGSSVSAPSQATPEDSGTITAPTALTPEDAAPIEPPCE